MASKYAYIVTACYKYTPELCALLNSLEHVGNKQDVYVLGYKLEDPFVEQFKNLSYRVIFQNILEEEARQFGGVAEITCRKRYWYAAELGMIHDAICILDADMVFVRNPVNYFLLAATSSLVIGVHKEQNKVYDHVHHTARGKWLLPKGYYNPRELCNCPMFINAKAWEGALRDSWLYFANGFPEENFKAPDMDAINIALIVHGAEDKIIKLSNHSWLGTNESLLKPYTRATKRGDGQFYTENGQDIYSYHGQYYKDKWCKCQLDNRHGCANGYLGCAEKSDSMATGSMELMRGHFMKMLDYKITIEKKDYIATYV